MVQGKDVVSQIIKKLYDINRNNEKQVNMNILYMNKLYRLKLYFSLPF